MFEKIDIQDYITNFLILLMQAYESIRVDHDNKNYIHWALNHNQVIA